MAATVDLSGEFLTFFNFERKKRETEPLNVIFENSSLKGLFEANKKKLKFRFCRPILENFRISLLRKKVKQSSKVYTADVPFVKVKSRLYQVKWESNHPEFAFLI